MEYRHQGTCSDLQPGQEVTVTATRKDGTHVMFPVTVRLDTPVEVQIYRHGGILHKAIRDMLG